MAHLREESRMPQEELLRRIDRELVRLKLSDRKACLLAQQRAIPGVKVGIDFIRDIRRRGHSPKADKLSALASVLGVSPDYLISVSESASPGATTRYATIQVKGAVQAGVYREAIEW